MDLNDLNQIKQYDPKGVFQSTGYLMAQIGQITQLSGSLKLDPVYSQVKNIVISGMGGSAYGGQVAQALFKDQLKLPLVINNDYTLPNFVNSETLVILTSYSGGTEEVLAAYQDARQRGARTLGLTSGGELAQTLLENSLPVLTFEPKFNPSGQPRLGTGYIVMGTINLLQKLGLINLEISVEQLINNLNQINPSTQDAAKQLAPKIFGKIPVIFASDFLVGNAHILRNQFNETAKSFSAYSPIPELNHHLMEGLKNPPDKKLIILFLNSSLYPEIIHKRIKLTQDVVGKNNIESLNYDLTLKTKLEQVFEGLLFGSYLTFYLAILYQLDPSLIPWVDYFKDQLAKV